MERRHVLLSSAAFAAGVAQRTASPNDTIRVTCVGVRGQGKSHIT